MKTGKKALFILRLGLGIFIMLWGLDKLFAPEATVMIFKHFYLSNIGVTAAYVLGGLETLLGLIIILGKWKKYSYGIAMIMHAVSTLSTTKLLINPFGDNHLFIAAIPVLAAFIALYLMREEDTLYSL